MTTHQPPSRPYHRLPHYLNDAPPSGSIDPRLRAAHAAADVTNTITDREQSDRDVRTDALDSACRLFAEALEPGSYHEGADSRAIARDVVLVADVFAHYIASGVVPPAPTGGLNLPLKLDDGPLYPATPDQPWPTGGAA